MITEQLLSERYKFKEDYIPYRLTPSQKDARKQFLDKVHKKKKYIFITKCPYCGNDDLIKISEVEKRGLPADIVICNACGGCFKSKVLDEEANKYHYKKISYVLRGKEISDEAIESTFWNRVKLFAYPRYHFISHFIELSSDKDFIVEFGCNDGANLFPWSKKGFTVCGIELDSRMVEFGQKKGLNLIYGDLMNYNFSNKKPRLIILSHMLEHISDVNAALIKLFEILQPHGYLFIEVPGIRVQGLGDALRYFDAEHNYYFDLNSLSRILKKHLFKIIYADEYIRLLCTPNSNQFIPVDMPVSLSLDKIKARFIKIFLEAMNFENKNLHRLLMECKGNNLAIKIFNRLQTLYFKYHYSSILKAQGYKSNV